MKIEIEKEEDGRWITEVPDLPGVMAYGQTKEEVIRKVEALALRVLLEREGWPDFVFAFHDREEIGPRMLARIAKKTGLTPRDL